MVKSLCLAAIFSPLSRLNKVVIAPKICAVCWQPLCCLNNTVQIWVVRQGAKVQFAYGTWQHKSLWFTEEAWINNHLIDSLGFLSISTLPFVLSNKSPPCVSVRGGEVWMGSCVNDPAEELRIAVSGWKLRSLTKGKWSLWRTINLDLIYTIITHICNTHCIFYLGLPFSVFFPSASELIRSFGQRPMYAWTLVS